MNQYIFTDIVYAISYFDENLSTILSDHIYESLYKKLIRYIDRKYCIEWYVEDKLHRLVGPAEIYKFGAKMWYQKSKLHRTYGPAMEWPGYCLEWYQNGELHRVDGPAVENVNGYKEWWQCGKKIKAIGNKDS